MYVAWKIAPALAAGNTFVFKSSEKAPFTPLLVAPLFKEAGFPPGVVNFISGGGLTGALLASHMDIDKISFTGSGFTGRKVQDAANKSNMKKVTLELGGKSPAIIFDDANIENAVAQYVLQLILSIAIANVNRNSQGFLFNTSQVCAATSRVFVQKSIAPKFIEALKGAFKQSEGAFGADPAEATTMLGPLADKLQYERVMSFIESGKKDSGAELLVGGDRIEGHKGLYVQPTIFLDAKEDSKIYREEVFGPVLNIRTFETEEEAIKLANDTNFGLSSAVYTESGSRGLRVASKIKAGTVGINGVAFPHHTTPFGGFKQSGYGRELGKAGLFAYLQEKTISINLAV
jgi:aldehyde dehydrogenase (NAD+)